MVLRRFFLLSGLLCLTSGSLAHRSRDLQPKLLGLLDLDGLLAALHDVLRLDAHDAAAPAPANLRVVVELGLEVVRQRLHLTLVLLPDGCQRHTRGGLLVAKLPKPALALDDAIWHILLAAERRQPADKLDGVDIVRNDHQLGHLVLDQGSHVVQAVFEDLRFLCLHLLAVFLCLRHLHEALLFGLLGLRQVLIQEPEEGGGLILVNAVVELVDRRWHLQTHEHDPLHPLQADILGPLHKA
mmetsp:Transcript_17537/g.49999  ORF Transcript_17537/g.49999 Transcript_17537/m.49999 type:complete len:241 (+) Transcript_17537:98-820(+)